MFKSREESKGRIVYERNVRELIFHCRNNILEILTTLDLPEQLKIRNCHFGFRLLRPVSTVILKCIQRVIRFTPEALRRGLLKHIWRRIRGQRSRIESGRGISCRGKINSSGNIKTNYNNKFFFFLTEKHGCNKYCYYLHCK